MFTRLRSVRGRTTVAATLVVGLALAVGVVALLVVLRRSLVSSVDGGIHLRSGVLTAAAATGAPLTAVSAPNDDSSFVQITDASGKILAASSNIEGEPPLLTSSAQDGIVRTVSSLPISEGTSFRVLTQSVATPTGTVHMLIASSLASVDRSLAIVGWALAVGAPGL